MEPALKPTYVSEIMDDKLKKKIDYILNYETTKARKRKNLSFEDAEEVISMCLERVAKYGGYEFEFVFADFMKQKYGCRQHEKGRAKEAAIKATASIDSSPVFLSIEDNDSAMVLKDFESFPIFGRKQDELEREAAREKQHRSMVRVASRKK